MLDDETVLDAQQPAEKIALERRRRARPGDVVVIELGRRGAASAHGARGGVLGRVGRVGLAGEGERPERGRADAEIVRLGVARERGLGADAERRVAEVDAVVGDDIELRTSGGREHVGEEAVAVGRHREEGVGARAIEEVEGGDAEAETGVGVVGDDRHHRRKAAFPLLVEIDHERLLGRERGRRRRRIGARARGERAGDERGARGEQPASHPAERTGPRTPSKERRRAPIPCRITVASTPRRHFKPSSRTTAARSPRSLPAKASAVFEGAKR